MIAARPRAAEDWIGRRVSWSAEVGPEGTSAAGSGYVVGAGRVEVRGRRLLQLRVVADGTGLLTFVRSELVATW